MRTRRQFLVDLAGGAAVLEVAEGLDGLGDDFVAGDTGQRRDEGDPAGVVLVGRVVALHRPDHQLDAGVRDGNALLAAKELPQSMRSVWTELALLHMALSVGVDPRPMRGDRIAQFHFDPALRRMSTVDLVDDRVLTDQARDHARPAAVRRRR